MKTKKIKLTNLLKLLILLFIIPLFLWNCQEENIYLEDITPSSEVISPYESLSFNQVFKESDFKELIKASKTERYFNDTLNFKTSNKSENTNIFHIVKKTVTKIKTNNYTSYTFLIKRNNVSKNHSFENLVIENRKGVIGAYIIKYEPSEEYFTSKNMPFSGKLSISKINYNSSLLNKSAIECSWIDTYTRRGCTVHGYSGVNNPECANFGKEAFIHSRTYACFSTGGSYSFGGDTSTSGGSGGGKDTGGSSSTAPVFPCEDSVHGCAKIERQILGVINSLKNPISGDPIELYLIAKYKNSNTLNLSIFGEASNTISVGSYTLTPHYDSNHTLVFYAAIRDNYKNLGIQYIIKASALQDFKNKITLYTHIANIFYAGGIPSQGQIEMAAGDYWQGLVNMWDDAIHSAEWWAYAITTFGHAIVNLPRNTPISSKQTVPSWRVSLNEMTSEMFQGKVVTNSNTGVSVTINIPNDYLPRIADNGKGLLFQPVNSVRNNNLIKIMKPTDQYPKGYARFYNRYGQPMENPQINTNPGSNNTTHFEFN